MVEKHNCSYITGDRSTPVILSDLDIPYPQTWDEFTDTYPMNIIENSGSKQLRHVSPTFDANPSGPTTYDLLEYLQLILSKDDKTDFRASSGKGMVTYLNTDNRLQLAKKCDTQKLQENGPKNVLEALYVAGPPAPKKIRAITKDVFGTDIYFDYTDLGTLKFRVGSDFSHVSRDSREAFNQVAGYPILDDQGDGLRSFVGIMCALEATSKPIILLDEPEAFLHPPQATQLGEKIANSIRDNQQIFISTHSVDFLKGILNATKDIVIVRLSRSNDDVASAKVLDVDTLNQILLNPLLSSSRVLDGMFYKGVVATEADADAVFYQRLFQKIGSSDDIHFVNTHNKQTLKKVIAPYQKLGIKFALITDADIIREDYDLMEIVCPLSDVNAQQIIRKERAQLYKYFQSKDKLAILAETVEKLKSLAELKLPDREIPEVASMLYDIRMNLKKIRDDTDELTAFKRCGRGALPPELQGVFDDFYAHCARIGLFIVKVGEMESWLIDYGVEQTSNKSKWISNALDKLYDIEVDEEKEVWKFIVELRNFLTSNSL